MRKTPLQGLQVHTHRWPTQLAGLYQAGAALALSSRGALQALCIEDCGSIRSTSNMSCAAGVLPLQRTHTCPAPSPSTAEVGSAFCGGGRKSVRRVPLPLNTLALLAGLSSCTCGQRQSGGQTGGVTMLLVAALLREACHKHPLHLHTAAGRRHAKASCRVQSFRRIAAASKTIGGATAMCCETTCLHAPVHTSSSLSGRGVSVDASLMGCRLRAAALGAGRLPSRELDPIAVMLGAGRCENKAPLPVG